MLSVSDGAKRKLDRIKASGDPSRRRSGGVVTTETRSGDIPSSRSSNYDPTGDQLIRSQSGNFTMEGFTLDDLRAAVELSSVCMGIFDDTTGRVHSPNGALREIVRLDEFLVKVLAQSDERIFGHIEIGE